MPKENPGSILFYVIHLSQITPFWVHVIIIAVELVKIA